MKTNIKLGIIGAGRMGITHYSIINSHPNVELVGIAEPSKRINNLFSKYIKKVKAYQNYKDLIEKEPIDALLVCTPPHINYDIILKAHEYGLHVFVEKPFTTNLKHAIELDYLYTSKGLVNQVGYVNRFNDVFCKVKSFIEDGILGRIIRYKSEMFSCTISKAENGSGWRMSHECGGGAVYEMASHSIDLVNFIIGKPDRVIGTFLNKIYSKNIEDVVSSTFLHKEGISGTIYINWSDESYRKPTNKIEIFATNGKILVDQYSLKIFLKSDIQKHKLRQGWNTLYITDVFNSVPFYVRGNEFTRQLYHFVDSIMDNSIQPICTFKDGVETLDVIDQIFKDFKEHNFTYATY